MNRNQNSSSATLPPAKYGLYLSGTVIDRTRRRVPKNNPTTEIVTYTLSDNNERKYYVDDYAPSEYHDIGSFVSLPVYVKPYLKKNNDVSYNLCVQKQSPGRGEHF